MNNCDIMACHKFDLHSGKTVRYRHRSNEFARENKLLTTFDIEFNIDPTIEIEIEKHYVKRINEYYIQTIYFSENMMSMIIHYLENNNVCKHKCRQGIIYKILIIGELYDYDEKNNMFHFYENKTEKFVEYLVIEKNEKKKYAKKYGHNRRNCKQLISDDIYLHN